MQSPVSSCSCCREEAAGAGIADGGRGPGRGRLEALLGHPVTGWLLVLLPLVRVLQPVVGGEGGRFAARPAFTLSEECGVAAAWLLIAVLSLTPWRVIFPRAGWARGLNRHRRLVGVGAAIWATLHMIFWLVDLGAPDLVLAELDKPFIYLGMAAWMILMVLAITSARGLMRWFGRWWKPLHRFAYAAAFLAFVHQTMQAKAGGGPVFHLFAGLFVLQLVRLVLPVWRRIAARRRDAVAAAV